MKLQRLMVFLVLGMFLTACITIPAPAPAATATPIPALPTAVPPSPTPVVIVVTATPAPSATPLPASPTLIPPSPTPVVIVITATPAPSATPIPIPTATPTVFYSAPTLIGPFKNETLYPGDVTIKWDWSRELAADEYFEVLGWKEIEPERNSMTWTKERSWRFVINVGNYQMFPWISGLGQYYFAVKVIRGKDGKWQGDLSPESAPYPWRW